MRARVRPLVLLVALLVGGCGGDDEPASDSRSGPRLPVVPRAIADACAKAGRLTDFPALCPTRWPSPGDDRPPRARLFEKAAGVYLVDVENGFRDRGGYVHHAMVGGQARPFGRWPVGVDSDLRLTTRRVVGTLNGGGTYVQELPARPIGSARVHGARATVLQAPPYPRGGLHGGHVVALWNEAGHGYLASVHGERYSRDELVAIALALARSARP